MRWLMKFFVHLIDLLTGLAMLMLMFIGVVVALPSAFVHGLTDEILGEEGSDGAASH